MTETLFSQKGRTGKNVMTDVIKSELARVIMKGKRTT